jgi:predicted MFS family arabinose efflux permease
MYLVGGLATLVSMNVIGRLSDYLPRRAVFQCLAAAFAVPAIVVAHLPHGTPLAVVLTFTTLLMVLGSGRGIPMLALITAVPRASERGSFMSVNSSVQQLAITIGPLVTACLLRGGEGGRPLEGFHTAGWVSAALSLVCVGLITMLRPADAPVSPDGPIAGEPSESVESIVSARDARLAVTPPRG